MLTSFFAEKFAPFKDADIDEVAVSINPELVIEYQFSLAPASLVESKIAKKVAAQHSYSAESLSTCHSEA